MIESPQLIRSSLALAAALRTTGRSSPHAPALADLRGRELVPMYRLAAHSPEQEVAHAIQLIEETAERLRRLAGAYGEWRRFDPGAYFDLTATQAKTLVHLVERVSTVHVRFFVDLLLPSFQRALTCWQTEYVPAFAGFRHAIENGRPAARVRANGSLPFADSVQPRMVERWGRLLSVVDGVHHRLGGDITLLSMSGSVEERDRWRRYWQQSPQAGVDHALLPPLGSVRTLTLTFDFPLPAGRQPGRLRRLRRNRERRLRRRHP